jgi:GMC oxidoreductase
LLLDDLNQITQKKYDVVIFGAGPAGFSTALSLPKKINVLLVEAGDINFSEASQAFYDGEVVGDKYFDLKVCRLRQLGGSSNHWAGKSRMLDPFDFSIKKYAENAHWPISNKDLEKYLQPACDLLKIKPHFFSKPYLWDTHVESLGFEFSPVMFKFDYLQTIKESANIDLILNTAITAANIKNDRIEEVVLANSVSNKKVFKSTYYIFAMGGIENGRMLKFLAEDNAGSSLNKNENVGAYWMEHPHYSIGDYFYNYPENHRWHIGVSEKKKIDMQILNCNLNFEMPLDHNADGKLKKALRDLMCVDERIGAEISYGFGRNYCGGMIDAAWEQQPLFDNRIELSAEVDAYGIPKTVLNWHKSELDLRTIRMTAEYVAESMVKNNQAKIRLYEWLWNGNYPDDAQLAGNHHMGGTRMSASRKDGVVNSDLQCWDVSNLYIAGSSVFPSSGHANPTLTIVQLAVRLANHLSK